MNDKDMFYFNFMYNILILDLRRSEMLRCLHYFILFFVINSILLIDSISATDYIVNSVKIANNKVVNALNKERYQIVNQDNKENKVHKVEYDDAKESIIDGNNNGLVSNIKNKKLLQIRNGAKIYLNKCAKCHELLDVKYIDLMDIKLGRLINVEYFRY